MPNTIVTINRQRSSDMVLRAGLADEGKGTENGQRYWDHWSGFKTFSFSTLIGLRCVHRLRPRNGAGYRAASRRRCGPRNHCNRNRRDGVTAIESARPVDIVSSDTLERQGSSNLNDALKTAVPSLNVQKFVAQDGSAFVRPFSLRGLPPDQTLVLVNNKRRHRSALVQITNQPLAAGAQGADLSTIPSNAIKSIEVLRDGAAAQYGSDAIAGVYQLPAQG